MQSIGHIVKNLVKRFLLVMLSRVIAQSETSRKQKFDRNKVISKNADNCRIVKWHSFKIIHKCDVSPARRTLILRLSINNRLATHDYSAPNKKQKHTWKFSRPAWKVITISSVKERSWSRLLMKNSLNETPWILIYLDIALPETHRNKDRNIKADRPNAES